MEENDTQLNQKIRKTFARLHDLNQNGIHFIYIIRNGTKRWNEPHNKKRN